MKKMPLVLVLLVAGCLISSPACGQAQPVAATAANATPQSDADVEKKASDWSAALHLNDTAKESRVRQVILTHLIAIRDWHNTHSSDTVPAGINPATGAKLSVLDREVIADSTIPPSVHSNLMAGLKADLTPEQVEAVLDKYTVGKVAFTMNGYHGIVPDLTQQEEATILGFLKQAREEAVDYKNMKEISAIFKIHKTRCEQYLISNGRDWKVLYKKFVNSIQAKKTPAQPDE